MSNLEIDGLLLAKMNVFDRALSLAIDAKWDELERLACQRGLWPMLHRWWVRRQLRRLERGIPK